MDGFGDKKYSLINYIKHKIDKINHKSHKLTSVNFKENIWSIKVYESIIAIFIKKQKQTISKPITNKGIDDNAKDFRVEKNKQNKSFKKIFEKVKNYFR